MLTISKNTQKVSWINVNHESYNRSVSATFLVFLVVYSSNKLSAIPAYIMVVQL